MGICSSCIGRRKQRDDPEREPLLASTRTVATEAATLALPPPKTTLEKAADVVAAIRAGKLPSQTQVSGFLRAALYSQALDPHALQAATSQAHLIGRESLSKSGRRLLADVREVIEASIEWGQAKNNDNILQDLIYQTEHIHGPAVEADIAVSSEDGAALRAAVPTQTELLTDTQTLLLSLRQLSSLLLTSSTFRLLLSDAFLTLRTLIADTAAQTGSLASTVERVAGAAEEATRPGPSESIVNTTSERADAAINEASSVLDETRERWARLARESPDRVHDAVVARLQNVVNRAQQTPEYRKAALAILTVIRSYASRVRAAPAATPVVWAEPHLERALKDLGALISRSANDFDLSHLTSSLEIFVRTLFEDEHPAGREWFAHVDAWLGKALSEPGFAISSTGTRQAEELYSQAHLLFSSTQDAVASKTALAAQAVLKELSLFSHALSSDPYTTRLTTALSALPNSIPLLSLCAGTSISASAAYQAQHLRTTLTRDALSFVLPRLLRLVGALPMPRVEFKSESLDGALDALLLTAPTGEDEPSNASASVLPDLIKFSSWNETVLDLEGGGGARSVSRVRVHIDGLRVSARKVGYYLAWRGPVGWVGYEDEGLVSLDVGKPGGRGEGLKVEVEVEFDTDAVFEDDDEALLHDSAEAEPLFRVVDVKVDVPGLALKIDRSKHWIINKGLLQPLVGPVGRAAVRLAAAGQVKGLLGQAAQLGGEVWRDVRRTRHERWHAGREDEDGPKDWVDAISRKMKTPEEEDAKEQDVDDDEEEVQEVQTETSVKPTTKGVVVTMTTSAPDDAASNPAEEEQTQTQIAIGLGAQILPGKGGPHDSHTQSDAPAETTREVLEEVQEEINERVQVVEENVDATARKAEQVREDVEQAEVRAEVRMQKERRKKGWKSSAFDL